MTNKDNEVPSYQMTEGFAELLKQLTLHDRDHKDCCLSAIEDELIRYGMFNEDKQTGVQ